MIEFTSQQLHENTQYIQNIAKNQAVLIENGDSKQVLLSYQSYVELGDEKPSPNLAQCLSLPKELADLIDDDLEFDVSFLENE